MESPEEAADINSLNGNQSWRVPHAGEELDTGLSELRSDQRCERACWFQLSKNNVTSCDVFGGTPKYSL